MAKASATAVLTWEFLKVSGLCDPDKSQGSTSSVRNSHMGLHAATFAAILSALLEAGEVDGASDLSGLGLGCFYQLLFPSAYW